MPHSASVEHDYSEPGRAHESPPAAPVVLIAMSASPSDVYERYIQPFTRPSALALVASLPLVGSERVLDHGSGTGLLVRLLLARYPGLRVCALDPSEALLEGLDIAAHAGASVEKIPETLEQYRSRDNAVELFDAVVSNYSLQFCGDTTLELERMRACCRVDGQLRVAVLGAACDVVPFHLFWTAVQAAIPAADPSTSYVHHKLGDALVLESSAKAAGWSDVKVTSEIASRRLTATAAWTWLSRVLPVSVGGEYRPITAMERRKIRQHFLPTWPVHADVPTAYHRLSARNAK